MERRKPYWVLVRGSYGIIVGNDDPAELLRHADEMLGPYDSWIKAREARDELRGNTRAKR